MINPNNENHVGQLFGQIEESLRKLGHFRRARYSIISDYCGHLYGSAESGFPEGDLNHRREIYLNVIHQAAEVYTQSLAANRPQVMVSTKFDELKPFAHRYQTGLNNHIQEIRLEDTLQSAVLDAFFWMGVVKVFSSNSHLVEIEQDVWIDPGKPFADTVSTDNFFFDMTQTKWSKIRYAGDSYRVPFDVLSDDIYDQKVVDMLNPSSRAHYNFDGDDRTENLSGGDEYEKDDLEAGIDLADIWLAHEGMIGTWAVSSDTKRPLHVKPLVVRDGDIPEGGPYHRLTFGDVPDNIAPVSPGMQLYALSNLINNLMRKQARQARRQKDIWAYEPGAASDMTRTQRTGDGQSAMVQRIEGIQLMKMGGVDPANQAFLIDSMDKFDRMAGNLTAMAGLGPQSDTVGQDELIHSAVSKKESAMQQRVLKFTSGICQDLGMLLWQDGHMQIPGEYEVEGTDIKVPMNWEPDVREGDFVDYNFDVEPFSQPYQSPSQRANAAMGILDRVILPLQEQMQSQGGYVDVKEVISVLSDMLHLPRVRGMVKFDGQNTPRQNPTPPQGGKQASHTVRTNVRKNIPTGGTPQARSESMKKALFGASESNGNANVFSRNNGT